MKAELIFDLPEDERYFREASQAGRILGVLRDYDNWLRAQVKYSQSPGPREDVLQEARDKLQELLGENNVELFE